MANKPDPDRTEGIWARCERLLEAFEQSWQEGSTPLLDAALAEARPEDRARLVYDLVLVELEQRFKRGEPVALDPYLARFPTLLTDGNRLAELRAALSCWQQGKREETPPSLSLLTTVNELRNTSDEITLSGSDVSRFRVLRPHAKGGLGQVSVALDEELHREVALKEIQGKHANNAEARARFLLEAEITGKLEHPGVVPVYGMGRKANGEPYYAMRFIKGESLKDAIGRFHKAGPGRSESDRRLELRKLLGRFIDTCNAIAYAHSRGVLHRDLKPSNIMLGQYGETLVVDWGLAKKLDQAEPAAQEDASLLKVSSGSGPSLTGMGKALGTPAYMSPEQAAGRMADVGPASDIYSLGATLYCLLTEKPPFEGDDVPRLLERVQKGDFARPRTANPQAEPALEAVCLKAMALHAEDRYKTARALADDVERWLADDPVQAWPEPLALRAGRWMRRQRALVAGTAAALVVGFLGLATATVLLGEANQRERAAKQQAQNNEKKAEENAKKEEAARLEAQKATAAEQLANLQVQKRLSQIQKANELLAAVFTDLNPRIERKEDPSLRVQLGQRLQTVARQLDAETVADPLALAELQNRLGYSLRHLGYPLDGVKLHEKAWEAYKTHLGPDHVKTLSTINQLTSAYYATGQLAEALSLCEETLAKCRERFGGAHPETLASMNNLARAYQVTGQMAKGLPLIQELLDKQRAISGPDDPRTLQNTYNLAAAYAVLNQLHKAIPLYQESLAKRKDKLGPDHIDTLQSMNGLALAYREAKDLGKALPLFEETLAKSKDKLGIDHPRTLLTMYDLALTYRDTKDLGKALPLFEVTLAKRKEKLGPDHPDTLRTMQTLALAYQEANDLGRALPLFEETVAKRKEKLGTDDPDTIISMNYLALAYHMTNQLTKAIPLYEQTLEKSKDNLGPDHADTLRTMNNLALAYRDSNDLAKALALFEETAAKRKEKLGPDHPGALLTMHNLALVYQDLNDLDKALPLFEETLAKRKKVLGPADPETLKTMNSLAVAYHAAGQLAKALPLFEETLAKRKEKLGPDHPNTRSSMSNLAAAYRAAGQPAKAQALEEESLTAKQKAAVGLKVKTLTLLEADLANSKAERGPDHPETLRIMDQLAKLYRDQGEPAKAVPLYEVLLAQEINVSGPDDFKTLGAKDSLASAYRAAGQAEKAVPLREEVLAKRLKLQGPRHMSTLSAMNNLAWTYQSAGRLAKALVLYEETLDKWNATVGPNHAEAVRTKNNLELAYQQAHHPAKIGGVLEELLAARKKGAAEASSEFAIVLQNLGAGLLKPEKHMQAETALTESLTILQAKMPNHWLTANGKSLLGASLTGQKKHAEAEPLLLDGHAGLAKLADEIPAHLRETTLQSAIHRLVQHYEASNQSAKAAESRAKLPGPGREE